MLGYLNGISFLGYDFQSYSNSQKISLNILTYPTISYHIPTYPKISSGANSQMALQQLEPLPVDSEQLAPQQLLPACSRGLGSLQSLIQMTRFPRHLQKICGKERMRAGEKEERNERERP